MDIAIKNSIHLNTISSFNRWNIYEQDVEEPIFSINTEEQPSYTSVLLQEELDQAIAEFDDASTTLQNRLDLEELQRQTDPFYPMIKKRSNIKYVGEYYELLDLDTQLNLISEKDVVLTFDPKYLQYLYEKNCFTILILLEGKGAKDKSQNNEDEKYYDGLSSISSQPDRVERISFLKELPKTTLRPNLRQRWAIFDKLSDENFLKTTKTNVRPEAKLPADLIIHVEETFGRLVDEEGNGIYFDRENPFYDKTFFDPVIKGLAYLKPGGKFILKLSSFSTRFLADICYLYKYLFYKICISKPVTTNPISQEFYLVAIGFNIQRYQTIRNKLDQLLIEIDKLDNDEEFALRSFITNTSIVGKIIGKQYDFGLDEQKIIETNRQSASLRPLIPVPQPFQSIGNIGLQPNIFNLQPKEEEGEEIEDEEDRYDVAEIDLAAQKLNYRSLNFIDWLYEINDQIALWIYMNIKTLSRTVDDRLTGFNDGHPFFIYDSVQYRESLGLLGRTTFKSIPTFTVSDEIVENLPEEPEIKLDDINISNSNFSLYLSLIQFINAITNLEYTLPAIKSMYGNETVTSATRYRLKQERSFFLREWLGILYSLGFLQEMLKSDEAKLIQFFIEKEDLNRPYLFDFLMVKSINIQQFYRDLAKELAKILQIQADLMAKISDIRKTIFITPLDNMRYRITYSYNGKKYGLMYRNNASVIGDFELMDMLTSAEKLQVDDTNKLLSLLRREQFKVRLVEHCCLPILFSGLPSINSAANETAIPSLYLRYKPEVEAFASAPNRYAPIWCSADPEDVKLGSSGNFFGEFSKANNPIFDKIKLMIAFPPTNDLLFLETVTRCCDIIKYRKEKADMAIIIVYWDTPKNANVVAEKTFTCGIDAEGIIDVKTTYNPFTGHENYDAKLKALIIKTDNSSFQF